MDRTSRGGAAGPQPAESRAVVLTRETIDGAATLVVACPIAVVVFPAAEPGGRVLVVAIACGVLAAILTGPWAIAVIAVCAALAFVLQLAQPAAEGSAPGPWEFTPLIGLAVLLGAGYRRLFRPSKDDR